MSFMKAFGTNLATLSPEGQQGMMLALGAGAQGRRAEWDAMNRQVGHLGRAFGAHRLGQQERAGGYERAHDAVFGGAPESASEQLRTAIADIGPMLRDRSNDLSTAMENAQEAFGQSDAMRNAGTRAPGGGSAFEQAQANVQGADQARAEGREAQTLGAEGMGDAMRGMMQRYGEGLHGAGLAGLRAGVERDVGQAKGRGQDAVAGIRTWQAGQEQPEYNPLADVAGTFGPGMIRSGLAQGRQRRRDIRRLAPPTLGTGMGKGG